MAFVQDIKDALPSLRGPRFSVTIYDGGAAVAEYRGKPTEISADRVTVAVKGAEIVLSGRALKVTQTGDGQLFVAGCVTKVEVER